MKYTLASSRQWYNHLPGKRASAAMIVCYDDNYLLIKDDYKSAMTLPSGVIDPDESAKQTAIRETKEEAGIVVDPKAVEFFSVAYIKEHYGFKDRFHFYFIVEVDSATADSIKIEEGIEYYKWVDAKAIGRLTGDRPAYARLSEMLHSGEAVPYFEV